MVAFQGGGKLDNSVRNKQTKREQNEIKTNKQQQQQQTTTKTKSRTKQKHEQTMPIY